METALHELIPGGSCIPVITLEDVALAVDVASVLERSGIRVVEFTLRAGDGFSVVAAVRHRLPDLVVGLGTVRTPDDMQKAAHCGAQFVVSPGFTGTLAAAARRAAVPWLPGVGTASEVMAAGEAGYEFLKFFPAGTSGGPGQLRQFAAVFPGVRFCPTGGITAEAAGEYLALDNVHCIGGSWITPLPLLQARDLDGIAALARRAAMLA